MRKILVGFHTLLVTFILASACVPQGPTPRPTPTPAVVTPTPTPVPTPTVPTPTPTPTTILRDGAYVVVFNKTVDGCAILGFPFVPSYNSTVTISNNGANFSDSDPALTRLATGSITGLNGIWAGVGTLSGRTLTWTYQAAFDASQPVITQLTENMVLTPPGCTVQFVVVNVRRQGS